MSAFRDDLTFRLGEGFGPHTLTIRNPDGTAANLAGVSLTLVVREEEGSVDLLTLPLASIEPTTAGKATVAATAVEVAALAPYAGRVLRYRVADATGQSVERGYVYVAPAWGAV